MTNWDSQLLIVGEIALAMLLGGSMRNHQPAGQKDQGQPGHQGGETMPPGRDGSGHGRRTAHRSEPMVAGRRPGLKSGAGVRASRRGQSRSPDRSIKVDTQINLVGRF